MGRKEQRAAKEQTKQEIGNRISQANTNVMQYMNTNRYITFRNVKEMYAAENLSHNYANRIFQQNPSKAKKIVYYLDGRSNVAYYDPNQYSSDSEAKKIIIEEEKKIAALQPPRENKEKNILPEQRVLDTNEINNIKETHKFLETLPDPKNAYSFIDMISGNFGLIKIEVKQINIRRRTSILDDLAELSEGKPLVLHNFLKTVLEPTGEFVIAKDKEDFRTKVAQVYMDMIDRTELRYPPIRLLKSNELLFIDGKATQVIVKKTDSESYPSSFSKNTISIKPESPPSSDQEHKEKTIDIVSNVPNIFNTEDSQRPILSVLEKFTGLTKNQLFTLIIDVAERRHAPQPSQ